MLSIESLIRKPVTLKGEEHIVDLTAQTIRFASNDIAGTVLVSSDLQMRPDLVSRVYFGDANKFDAILSFSGVSNPFSIEEGQVLLVPSTEDINASYVTPVSEEKKKDIREKFFDPNKLSKKDAKRIQYVQMKAAQVNSTGTTPSILPPNFAQVGSKEISAVDGKVVFGPDVTGEKKCDVAQSRAKLKAKLIQNKIYPKN